MTIVDLGAAPGGWTQYISKLLKGTGKIFALDILPMDPLPGVTFFLGDFQEQKILDALLLALGEEHCDLVLSDMAPNTSGIRESDQAKAMYLAELALDCAKKILKRGGCFVVKIFQGPGVDEFIRMLRAEFQSVAIRKPKASRPRSKEVYLVAKGYDL
jgi:23S rRNA (uridine2552-2'-O)-methyltransferase